MNKPLFSFAIIAPPMFAATLTFGLMGGLTAAVDSAEDRRWRREHLESDLYFWRLVRKYDNEEITLVDGVSPVPKEVFERLRLPWGFKSLIKTATTTRDKILFDQQPPNVKSAGAYVQAQKAVSTLNPQLLYVLDPGLLSASLDENVNLMISNDLSSCRDGTYRTSVEFAAGYRNLVGEDAFQVRKGWYQREKDLTGKEPWYAERADYLSRLVNSTPGGKDIF